MGMFMEVVVAEDNIIFLCVNNIIIGDDDDSNKHIVADDNINLCIRDIVAEDIIILDNGTLSIDSVASINDIFYIIDKSFEIFVHDIIL